MSVVITAKKNWWDVRPQVVSCNYRNRSKKCARDFFLLEMKIKCYTQFVCKLLLSV